VTAALTPKEIADLSSSAAFILARHDNVFAVWRTLVDYRRHRRSTGDLQDPRSFGVAHPSSTPGAGQGRPSLSDGLSPAETRLNPLPYRSISEIEKVPDTFSGSMLSR